MSFILKSMEMVEIPKVVGFVLRDQLPMSLKLIIMASEKRWLNFNVIGNKM